VNPVAQIYKMVIEDVIENIKEDFKREGVDESVLLELKALWEQKLIATHAVPNFVPDTPQYVPDPSTAAAVVGDLTHGYLALPTQAPRQRSPQAIPQPMPQATMQQQQHQQTVHNLRHLQEHEPDEYGYYQDEEAGYVKQEQSFGKPADFISPFGYPNMPGAPPPNQMLHSGTHYAHAPQIQQHYQHQHPHLQQQPPQQQQGPPAKRARLSNQPLSHQQDGEFDDDDDDLDDDEEVSKTKKVKEDNLNSDDDLSDSDEEVPNTPHIVLSQFEKVSRTKNKWKCALKCGIMHLNGQDYVFHSASGEFDW